MQWAGYDAVMYDPNDASSWTPEAIQQALASLGVSPQQLMQQPVQAYQQPSSFQQQQQKGTGKGKKNREMSPLEQQQHAAEMAMRQHDLQNKRAEESDIREQHRAALVVRKVIQKVKLARPETLEYLRSELEMAITQNMMAMGPMTIKVQEEAEKVLAEAQAKVTEAAEKAAEEERLRIEAEMQQREEEVKVETMGEEASMDVDEVESKVHHAEELAKPLQEGDLHNESPEGLLEAAVVAEEASESALNELNIVAASVKDKWSSLSKKPGPLAHSMLQKIGPQFRKLNGRLTACRRTLVKLQETVKVTKDKVGKKAAALKKEREERLAFDRADADGDDMLNPEEMAAYVLAECQLTIDVAQMDSLFIKVAGRDQGISFSKLTLLRRAVDMLRSQIQERARKEEQARLHEEFEEAIADFKAMTSAAIGLLAETDTATEAARAVMRPFFNRTSDRLTEDQLADLVARSEEALDTAREKMEELKSKFAEAEAEADSPRLQGERQDVVSYRKAECKKLHPKVGNVQNRLDKLIATAGSAKVKSKTKAYADIHRSLVSVVTAIRRTMVAEGKSAEEVFGLIAGDSGPDVLSKPFIAYVRSLADVDISVEQASSLFNHLAEEGSCITLTKFSDTLALLYKVVKSTMFTADLPINSKVVRRLDIGEFLRLSGGPRKDEKVGVSRIHCHSLAREDDGWVTVAGNQGAVFLEPAVLFFHCIKESVLTDGLSIHDSGTLRTLEVGEIVEALGPEVRDESKGNVVRVRCKAHSDGMIGWVSVSGSGTPFLQAC
jgi:hypothetical protein